MQNPSSIALVMSIHVLLGIVVLDAQQCLLW